MERRECLDLWTVLKFNHENFVGNQLLSYELKFKRGAATG